MRPSMACTSSRRADATLDNCTQARLKSCVDEVGDKLDTRYVRVFVKNTNIMNAVSTAEAVFGSRGVVSFSVPGKHMLIRRYEGGIKTDVQRKLINDGEQQSFYCTASDFPLSYTADHKVADKTQGDVMLWKEKPPTNRRSRPLKHPGLPPPQIWGEVFWDDDGNDRVRALQDTIRDLDPIVVIQHVFAIGLPYDMPGLTEAVDGEIVRAERLQVRMISLSSNLQITELYSQNPRQYTLKGRKRPAPPYLVVWSRNEDDTFGDPEFWNVNQRNCFVDIGEFRLNFNKVLDAFL